jgi:hypothetical protein
MRATGHSLLSHVLEQVPYGDNYHIALDCDGLDPAVIGRFRSESVAAFRRNRWPLCLGFRSSLSSSAFMD